MIMTTFKLIKSKEFDTNGTKGTAHTVAYKGRAMNVSTLSFADEADAIKVDKAKNTLTIDCKIEVVKRPYINDIGESVVGLAVMPALGLELSDI